MNSYWGDLIIEELVRNGIDYFCVSPGSRSTPLTVAAARHPRARTIVCYDERGAAFHALGYARATGLPAALICTSGTAAANYLPAVIEADVDGVPMLILSADRPPELRHTMANQTIEQVGMFNRYTRWQVDMPVPTAAIKPQFVLTTIDQAVHRAICAPMGPVHLNCMFRKPLEPVAPDLPDGYAAGIAQWRQSAAPYTQYVNNRMTADIAPLQAIISQAKRGIIAVGQLRTAAEQEAVRVFADWLGWPLFADIGSGLRLGETKNRTIIHYFDQLLLSTNGDKLPDTVIHIGGQFVSKRWIDYCARVRPSIYAVIKPSPERIDPFHGVTHRFDADISTMLSTVVHSNQQVIHRSGWLDGWRQRSQVAGEKVSAADRDPLDEIGVAQVISAGIGEQHALFVGNSMPVRDMDMYGTADGARPIVAINRGASGIDGNLSTGMGLAVGTGRPTTILVGDLTFMHDINALTLLRQIAPPITLVVINNAGGGIFHHLPIAEYEDVFEPYFGTPHPFAFGQIAAAFGVAYTRVDTFDGLQKAYSDAMKGSIHQLIEVRTERVSNMMAHKKMGERMKDEG